MGDPVLKQTTTAYEFFFVSFLAAALCSAQEKTKDTGFAEAVFDPRPGDLRWAKGEVPTPHGVIRVEWKRKTDGRIVGEAIPPAGVAIISKVTK